jgi:hypothetical protein
MPRLAAVLSGPREALLDAEARRHARLRRTCGLARAARLRPSGRARIHPAVYDAFGPVNEIQNIFLEQ